VLGRRRRPPVKRFSADEFIEQLREGSASIPLRLVEPFNFPSEATDRVAYLDESELNAVKPLFNRCANEREVQTSYAGLPITPIGVVAERASDVGRVKIHSATLSRVASEVKKPQAAIATVRCEESPSRSGRLPFAPRRSSPRRARPSTRKSSESRSSTRSESSAFASITAQRRPVRPARQRCGPAPADRTFA
jgi:hypothetical protein